jgi:DNA-binding GntR family transcriptional regulator
VRARAELRAVLAALDAGDGRRAADLMTTAIGAFRDELVDALRTAALDLPLSGLAGGGEA